MSTLPHSEHDAEGQPGKPALDIHRLAIGNPGLLEIEDDGEEDNVAFGLFVAALIVAPIWYVVCRWVL